jgi:hypothetical protein
MAAYRCDPTITAAAAVCGRLLFAAIKIPRDNLSSGSSRQMKSATENFPQYAVK